MSLLNKASLIQIPSGYKDGTLYSAKPTNGDGDFTFSRGSNLAATRVNSDGLIEKGRENLLRYSNDFTSSAWLNYNTTRTGGQSGYDGSSDAWLFEKSAANARIVQTLSQSGVQTFSVYAKANSLNWLKLQVYDGTSLYYAHFDLANGVLGSGVGLIDRSIVSAGGGWYRCSISVSVNNQLVYIYPADGNNDTSGTSGSIYIQDAQLEAGLVATDYIETGASTAQAGILEDMPRLDYSGGATCPSLLLEPQRSNLITQSEYGGDYLYINTSYVQNTQVSPEGVINSTTIESDTTYASHYFGSNFHYFTSGTTYTSSIFIKKGTGRYLQLTYGFSSFGTDQYANYDLQDGVVTYEASLATASIEDFGNGWYRCVLTATATSNFNDRLYAVFITSGTASRVPSHSSSLNYYFYGFQMEAGSYPTSYIPTYGASVTRSADGYDNTTGISGLLGSTTGTFFVDMERFNIENRDASGGSLELRSSDGQTELNIDIEAAGSTRSFYRDGGSFNFIYQSTELRCKFCFVYNGANLKLYHNGVKQFDSNVLSLQNFSELTYTGVDGAKKHHQILLFPTPLTDQEAIDLTTI